ncbi:MAG: hypothetical protein K6V36_07570 [Anaerolineae bacterium]|nr:hypothetical protein [Anaerolineae bacterium]
MEEGRESRVACEAYCPLCWTTRMARAAARHVAGVLPHEFWEHGAAARRESLLALRSLIDAALSRSAPAPARKATRIKVE